MGSYGLFKLANRYAEAGSLQSHLELVKNTQNQYNIAETELTTTIPYRDAF